MTTPIRRRLMRMMLLTSGLVILFSSALFVTYDVATFRQGVIRQLETLGSAIARNSTAALAFQNADDAREVLDAFEVDPHIVSAALYDASGAQFAAYRGPAPARLDVEQIGARHYFFEGGFAVGYEPVMLEGRRLGTLVVRSDLSAITARIWSFVIITGLVIALSALVAWIISTHQQKQISLPILALAQTARAVSDRRDYSVRAQGADLLELNQLTDAFNHMLTQIGAADARTRAHMGRLSLLQHITAAIGDRQDLPSIFNVVLRNVEENLPVDFAAICEYDSAAQSLKVMTIGAASRTHASALDIDEASVVPIDENGLSRCIRGTLVYEPDVRNIPFPFPMRFMRAGLHSLVIAPLAIEASVFGVFIAARRASGSFSSGDCEFLLQLSSHVALASHQTRLHAALQRAYDDLRQSQNTVMQQERLRALGQMASGIAHDINNAISPVSLYTEALLEREPNLSPRARSSLQVIQQAIDGVAETVARMREFYRQREPEMMLTLVNVNRTVESVIELTRAKWADLPQQRGLSIDLRMDFSQELPGIMGAEGEIRDALTNLIFNAVDAMPTGGTLTVRTSVERASGDMQLVIVEVTDTGIGMDEDTRRRCLEPFFTTKGERGTGLGLAMVYGMIQRHSAEFEIDSTPGKGTTMRIAFPAYTQPMVAAPRPNLSQAPIRRLRVLVVDDDPIIIRALEDALGGDGHVVVSASGGQAGIDTFASAAGTPNEFALVITDLGMPHVDGRRVAENVKRISGGTPVFMLTGWGNRMIAEHDTPAHVDRVLSKPPRLADLRLAIRELAG
jgi:signal transduction histidine kinase/ActR/RegA family two-component response regulator